MFKTNIAGSIKDVKNGFGYLISGARHLGKSKDLWSIIIAPVLINALLFALFLWGIFRLLSLFLSTQLPTTWWGILIAIIIVVASVVALLFIGAAIYIFIGSIVSAPFYDVLAERVTRSEGGIVTDHPWWKGAWRSMKHSAQHLVWFLLVQAGLIFLNLIPAGIGPIVYVTLGFATTAFFLSFDFLDYSFDFRGWAFAKRRKWCMQHKGLVLGFGTAIFLGLAIPGINLLIPPIAIVGSILMFNDQS